jgi:membrane-bound lytic murein transglycosylase D
MRRAGEGATDFWSIYPYLPKETRNYVPAFIGATYAYNYHRQHGIEATPSPLPLATDTIHLNRIMHFEQVSSTIKTPIDVIRSLNPQYRLDIVPAVSKTYTLTLPRTDLSNYLVLQDTIMAKDTMYLAQYLKPTKADPSKQEFSIESYTYTVKKGDVLKKDQKIGVIGSGIDSDDKPYVRIAIYDCDSKQPLKVSSFFKKR